MGDELKVKVAAGSLQGSRETKIGFSEFRVFFVVNALTDWRLEASALRHPGKLAL